MEAVIKLSHYFIAACSLVLSLNAIAEVDCEMSVGWMERPSYQYAMRNGQPAGFDISYIKAIAKEIDCEITFRKMPWPRQDADAVAGRLDILLGALSDGSADEKIVVSEAYRQDPIGFYIKKQDISKVKDAELKDLFDNGFKLGMIRHDTPSKAVKRLSKKHKYRKNVVPVHKAKALLRNLNRGMIDGAMLHSAEIDFLKSKNDPLVKDLLLVPHLSFTTPAYLIMGRASPLGESFILRLNSAIKSLDDKGITNKLVTEFVPSHMEIE